jgi:hypothetical protein
MRYAAVALVAILAGVAGCSATPALERGIATIEVVGSERFPIGVVEASLPNRSRTMAEMAFYENFLAFFAVDWIQNCQRGEAPFICEGRNHRITILEDEQEIIVHVETIKPFSSRVSSSVDIYKETPVLAARRAARDTILALMRRK